MKIIKKKYTIIIIIISILCLLSILTSFVANDCLKDSINNIFKWISGLSSLITLSIALLLFDKYGLNKKIKDKKQDIVLELLDELSKSILILETNVGEGGSNITSYFLASGDSFKPNINFSGKELIFSDNYTSGIDRIVKYSKNYWLPKSIQAKLENACLYFIIFDDNVNPFDEKYIRIKFSTDNDYLKDKTMKYGIISNNLKIDNYCQKWVDLHDIIINWLNENADFKVSRE